MRMRVALVLVATFLVASHIASCLDDEEKEVNATDADGSGAPRSLPDPPSQDAPSIGALAWHPQRLQQAFQLLLQNQAQVMNSNILLLVPPLLKHQSALTLLTNAAVAMRTNAEQLRSSTLGEAEPGGGDASTPADKGPPVAGPRSVSSSIAEAPLEILDWLIQFCKAAERRLEHEVLMRKLHREATVQQLLDYYYASTEAYKEEASLLQLVTASMMQNRLQAIALPPPAEAASPSYSDLRESEPQLLTLHQVAAGTRLCSALHSAFGAVIQSGLIQETLRRQTALPISSGTDEEPQELQVKQELQHDASSSAPAESDNNGEQKVLVLLADPRDDIHEGLQLKLGIQEGIHAELAGLQVPLAFAPLWFRAAVSQTDFLAADYQIDTYPGPGMGSLRSAELAFYRMQLRQRAPRSWGRVQEWLAQYMFSVPQNPSNPASAVRIYVVKALSFAHERAVQEAFLMQSNKLRTNAEIAAAASIRATEFEQLALLTRRLSETLKSLTFARQQRTMGPTERNALLQKQKAQTYKFEPQIARRLWRRLSVGGWHVRYSELAALEKMMLARAAALRELAEATAAEEIPPMVAGGRSLLGLYHSRLSVTGHMQALMEMAEAAFSMISYIPYELVKTLASTVLLPAPVHAENTLW